MTFQPNWAHVAPNSLMSAELTLLAGATTPIVDPLANPFGRRSDCPGRTSARSAPTSRPTTAGSAAAPINPCRNPRRFMNARSTRKSQSSASCKLTNSSFCNNSMIRRRLLRVTDGWRIPRKPVYLQYGKVQEWLNWHAWKACVPETVPRVRIPPFPQPYRGVSTGFYDPKAAAGAGVLARG